MRGRLGERFVDVPKTAAVQRAVFVKMQVKILFLQKQALFRTQSCTK